MNGLYGSTANAYFIYYISDMAQAITASGQLSVKWAAQAVNQYLNKALKTDDVDYVAYADTDSVVGDSVIYVNDKQMTIEEYYDSLPDNFMRNDTANNDYVKEVNNGDLSHSMSMTSKTLEKKPIKYIMKHRVRKQMYEIVVGGKSVIVTEDHSVIVEDKHTGDVLSIKPHLITPEKHRVVSIA